MYMYNALLLLFLLLQCKTCRNLNSRNFDQLTYLVLTASKLPSESHIFQSLCPKWLPQFYFFLFFFGGSSSELLSVLVLLLLEELESESESEEEEELVEESEEDELEELSSESLSSEDEEVDVSSLSDEESDELSLLLLLELVILLDLFFLVFFSTLASPLLCCNNLFSLSFKAFLSSAVLEGLCRYFLFPVHS